MYGGSVRVWANAWDVFRRTPSRGGPGRRAAVDLFRGVFFQCLVGFRVFSVSYTHLRAHETKANLVCRLLLLLLTAEGRERRRAVCGIAFKLTPSGAETK